MAFIEPCFGIGHNLSLICQMTSEDIKHQLIIITQTMFTDALPWRLQPGGNLTPKLPMCLRTKIKARCEHGNIHHLHQRETTEQAIEKLLTGSPLNQMHRQQLELLLTTCYCRDTGGKRTPRAQRTSFSTFR